MKEELVQKLSDKVLQLQEERKGYEKTYAQCEQELSNLREELGKLLLDYNGTINLLNGSVYSVEKINEELEAYNQDTLRPLSRKPQLELTVKKGY